MHRRLHKPWIHDLCFSFFSFFFSYVHLKTTRENVKTRVLHFSFSFCSFDFLFRFEAWFATVLFALASKVRSSSCLAPLSRCQNKMCRNPSGERSCVSFFFSQRRLTRGTIQRELGIAVTRSTSRMQKQYLKNNSSICILLSLISSSSYN